MLKVKFKLIIASSICAAFLATPKVSVAFTFVNQTAEDVNVKILKKDPHDQLINVNGNQSVRPAPNARRIFWCERNEHPAWAVDCPMQNITDSTVFTLIEEEMGYVCTATTPKN